MGHSENQDLPLRKAMISAREQRSFLIPLVLWLTFTSIPLLIWDKVKTHLFLNQWHHPTLDQFFKYATYLGDGIFVSLAILVLALFNIRRALCAGLAVAVASGITQILKRTIFADVKRPSVLLAEYDQLHLIEGVTMHSSYSFPSGHTTAAFALFTVIAISRIDPLWKTGLFLVATIAAYSRVYLSQHFLVDIWAGSIIGSSMAFLFASVVMTSTISDRGILELLTKKRKVD